MLENEDKLKFRQLTAEQKLDLCKAIIGGRLVQRWSEACSVWVGTHQYNDAIALNPNLAYRVPPRADIIPWNHINPDIRWVFRNFMSNFYGSRHMPSEYDMAHLPAKTWLLSHVVSGFEVGDEHWTKSLQERPKKGNENGSNR